MMARALRRPALLSVALVILPGCTQDGGTGAGASSYAHDRPPGASARDFLTSASYDRLVIEVQYASGLRPTDAALQALQSFLATRLNKPGGVEVRLGTALNLPHKATYSDAEVRALEKQYRTVYTTGTTMSAYLLFLDGAYAGGSNVLGISYNNTSMAVFSEQINANTGGVLQPSRTVVETTVMEHEVGHLLGLVNNGSGMQVAHQDGQHGEHCDNPNCLMYYAVRTTDFLSNLVNGVPPLDQHCLDDLRANGGK